MTNLYQHTKAQKLVDNVQEKISNDEHVNLAEEHRKAGYSEQATRAYAGKQTKTWQQRMQPFIDDLKQQRERVLKAFNEKDLSQSRAKDLVKMLDTLQQNIQLLGGNATENVQFQIVEGEVKQANNGKKEEKIRDADVETVEDNDTEAIQEPKDKQNEE